MDCTLCVVVMMVHLALMGLYGVQEVQLLCVALSPPSWTPVINSGAN